MMRFQLLKLRSTDAVSIGVTNSVAASVEKAGNTWRSDPVATLCIISADDAVGDSCVK